MRIPWHTFTTRAYRSGRDGGRHSSFQSDRPGRLRACVEHTHGRSDVRVTGFCRPSSTRRQERRGVSRRRLRLGFSILTVTFFTTIAEQTDRPKSET